MQASSSTPTNPAAQQQPQVPFVCIIPGRPAVTSFQPVAVGKWTLQIPNAQNVHQLTLFLTQPIQNPNYALTIYISPPPYQEWTYVGALSNNLPSNIFQMPKIGMDNFTAQLGIGLEPAEQVVQKKSPILSQEEEYKLFAKFIADDLFRFMESFNKQVDQRNELLLVPTKVLDMWYEKFNNKFRRDPFFWIRKG